MDFVAFVHNEVLQVRMLDVEGYTTALAQYDTHAFVTGGSSGGHWVYIKKDVYIRLLGHSRFIVGPTTLADQLASAGPVLKGGPCATIADHYRQRPSGSDGGDHEPETLRRAHRTHPARVPCGGRALVDEGRQSDGTKGRRGR